MSGSPYEMTISLTVLDHLGIGLYSNVPAVLSEVVANSYDADAATVDISIDVEADTITIRDDGHGMSRAEVNNKYLRVGYQRRTDGRAKTESGKRHAMGRKGIGKLSVFAIAGIVEVYTRREGRELCALRMSREDIRKKIEGEKEGTYNPEEIEHPGITFEKGTRIVLRDFDRSIARSGSYLRRRLARRFSVIGPAHDFEVTIDGAAISPADREFYKELEFLWHFGTEGEEAKGHANKLEDSKELDGSMDVEGRIHTLSGWIGTIGEPSKVADENKGIVVLAHGKLVHEDVLPEFKEAGVYADYVIGEINADFLDADDVEDIITSGRQFVKVTDPRYRALTDFVQKTLRSIKNEWSQLRRERGTERALENPVLKAWYEQRTPDQAKAARKLFGKIESLSIPDPEAKTEIYRSALLAFERMALRDTLSALDAIESESDFEVIRALFSEIDELEAAHYYQIVQGRLDVIEKFSELLPDSKEKALQEYLFEHLWLLDPSWERAAGNPRIEESVVAEFDKIDAKLTDEERAGRIDIRYKSAAGKHIIVELKKYDRRVSAEELLTQLRKYERALRKCVTTKYPSDPCHIEVVSILGKPLSPADDPKQNQRILESIGARTITYDELISNALASYQDYLSKRKALSKLEDLIDRIGEGFRK